MCTMLYCFRSLWPGPKPGTPRNLTVTEISNGFLITWQPPMERSHLIQYYTIKYKTDGPWKTLNKGQIRPEETSYLGEILLCLSLFPSLIAKQLFCIKFFTSIGQASTKYE